MGHRSLHAVALPAGPALLDALAAAMEGAGPAVLPLSPDLPRTRLRALLAELRPERLVTPEGTCSLAGGVGVGEDTALVLATSGTTGPPKGVELSAAALAHSARATLSRLGAYGSARWLACLPPDGIAGAQLLVRSVVSGTDPVYMPASRDGFDPEAALASGADFVSLVPTMLTRLLDTRADLSAFRAILLGGAPASPVLLERARAAGGTVVTTYGMTETSGGCVYDGVPLQGTRVDLRGDGRVRLAGPTLFSRYRLRPELTAAALDGAWLVTRDVGRWAGGKLDLRGRADDVVITGGSNVAPDDVAALLADQPGVADVAVVGRPDPEWGERLVAVIVPTQVGRPPTLTEVREYVRARAPAYLAPQEIEVAVSIPLLSSGKPDRAALRRGHHL